MPTVVGVRLRFSKTLWFDPAGTSPAEGETVIVETERGNEIGTVVQTPHDVSDEALPAALKPVVRVADEEDLTTIEELEAKEREAMPAFRDLVAKHRLDMKPVDVEYLLGGDKIVFYFSADERVDFRELVRDLASHFRARIDMRQVGVRDEARSVGGIGHCGQMLCCVRFGGEFQPVSIRMAKEQDLPLNPLKISGLCGRLMCCLRYEFDAYKDYKSRAPKRGAIIETEVGLAKVADLDTPRETVTMRFEDGNRVTVPLAKMGCGKGTGCPCSVSRETLEDIGAIQPVVIEEPEPVVMRPKPGSKAAGKPSGKPAAKPAAKPAVKPAEQTAEDAAGEGGEKSGRRRRRRGGSGKAAAGGAEGSAQQAAQAPKQDRAPKAAEAKPSEGGGADAQPAKGTRRRRRRRPGQGGEASS